MFEAVPYFNECSLKMTYVSVPSFLNDEEWMALKQTEVNHDISVGAAAARGKGLLILTLRCAS